MPIALSEALSAFADREHLVRYLEAMREMGPEISNRPALIRQAERLLAAHDELVAPYSDPDPPRADYRIEVPSTPTKDC